MNSVSLPHTLSRTCVLPVSTLLLSILFILSSQKHLCTSSYFSIQTSLFFSSSFFFFFFFFFFLRVV
ncbi:hypothetical protein O3M35_006597 [Rhynocoris fuscipes]|uniref:Uncharacterized protein n=1 Tax=Rhynocoris fuscipes TaxID=488301 RepID=A0AAW1DFH8_9HEMI